MKVHLGPEDRDTVGLMNDLVWAYLEARKLDEALPLFQTVLKLREASLGLDDPSTLSSMNDLAATFAQVKNYPAAETPVSRCSQPTPSAFQHCAATGDSCAWSDNASFGGCP